MNLYECCFQHSINVDKNSIIPSILIGIIFFKASIYINALCIGSRFLKTDFVRFPNCLKSVLYTGAKRSIKIGTDSIFRNKSSSSFRRFAFRFRFLVISSMFQDASSKGGKKPGVGDCRLEVGKSNRSWFTVEPFSGMRNKGSTRLTRDEGFRLVENIASRHSGVYLARILVLAAKNGTDLRSRSVPIFASLVLQSFQQVFGTVFQRTRSRSVHIGMTVFSCFRSF